ncbi:carboxymuconolactone decarboxylase family protein [Aureimonas pseudogalii]|uniref:4-carboxymuconolactone decarboxylase n=1 Tax=Aureimonas pseudogalii TaxID=1744844 RepID=A0A7W6H707_9HYPH|nr:carboxymuconolactone decarboxylase family protein [Aureimonas pseudogalii]MBB3999739.1 4-carboxymuconolactone decarboxylase [Aureimonas pseudogalii]
MKLVAATVATLALSSSAMAEDRNRTFPRVAPPVVRETVPALADYTDEVLFGSVWARPDLAPRDRSLVTVSALVAGGHVRQMAGHFGRALDNGVKPTELTEIITHLAFYSGWPNAMSAVPVAKEVFETRGIGSEQLAAVGAAPLPLDAVSERERAASVEAAVGPVAPALASYTNGVLFDDLWRRPELAPRDRSLVTMSALIAAGQADQLAFHMDRGMANGLTRPEVAEVITHLAFYTGWPNAMSAVPVAKTVFENRGVAAEGSTPASN